MDALLGDAEIREAVRRLRGDANAEDALARVAWSVVTEPGDGVAGTLIAELGAADALRFALGGGGDAMRGQHGDDTVPGQSAGSHTSRALLEGRARWQPRAHTRAVRDALRGAAETSAQLILPGDDHWPTAIDDLREHSPIVLWARGAASALAAADTVSFVGARAATGYGDYVAAEFAGDLAASGTLIVSGGAYGIDGAAHRAALGVEGVTVAFLAGGVDRPYPAGHQQLFGRIAGSGAVVSELPCGAAPTKWRFLSRNRLIAALGAATVVIEAGWRSGSLNTAGHAATLGRPLGAVPGPVTSAASAGCHRLMREYDARCVTSAAEVRELLGQDDGQHQSSERSDPDRVRLLDALSARTARSSRDLARRSGLSVERVESLLGLLTLEGGVRRDESGWRG